MESNIDEGVCPKNDDKEDDDSVLEVLEDKPANSTSSRQPRALPSVLEIL